MVWNLLSSEGFLLVLFYVPDFPLFWFEGFFPPTILPFLSISLKVLCSFIIILMVILEILICILDLGLRTLFMPFMSLSIYIVVYFTLHIPNAQECFIQSLFWFTRVCILFFAFHLFRYHWSSIWDHFLLAWRTNTL